MEAFKTNFNCGTQSKHNVVKVVELKRFMPGLCTDTVFRRKKFDWHVPQDEDVKIENLSDTLMNEEKNKKTISTEKTRDLKEKNPKSSQSKPTDKQKSKIIFKSCSHTAEELSKLTEHQDETLVKVGDTFESREAFRQYLYNNAKTWMYYYVCRNSKKKFMAYNCMCMAYTVKPRDIVLRTQKKRTTACPCKIRLTVDEGTKKVVAYYVCNHHDHCLSMAAFHYFPHAKYLPQEVKDEFLDLVYLGLNVDLIQKYIHSVVGITIKRKDICSYAYKFKRKTMQRNLTDDRKKYIEDLITKIRDTYGDTIDFKFDINSGQRWLDISTNMDDVVNINSNQSEANILDKVLNSNCIDLRNDDVIVQYINENGILCDQDGTPVANSSAIMQFINNYEHTTPDINVRDDELLEEGTVFSELVENVNDDVYPIDWDSIQETESVFMKVHQNESNVEMAEDLYTTNAETDEEALEETVTHELCSKQDNITVISNVLYTSDKSVDIEPTRQEPELYADLDIFNKYYFVDHRYIKFDGEHWKIEDQKQTEAQKKLKYRQRSITINTAAGAEEYIKAPKFVCYPSPLRDCFGHEQLTLLTDSDAILPGAKFLTHTVFLKYVNERASRWFFYYSLVESGKLPECYVYKCVFGKHRVSRNAYRAKGLRKRVKLTTQCPCQIRLRRLESEPTYLTVLYACNHHDHALNAQSFKGQPHSRRLPEHLKEEVKDLLAFGVTFDVLRKHVLSETGLRMYGKYFHNVKVKMIRNKESREFTEERIAALTDKIKDLEDLYGTTSKENPQCRTSKFQAKERTLSPLNIHTEEEDEASTQTKEYYQIANINDITEEVCIVEADSLQAHTMRTPSRLETQLNNISSQEDTLVKVKILQDSAKCDNLSNTYKLVQIDHKV